ncbi:hypothetical protein HO133_011089 [Letharia lupina]|uniref:Actin-like ATPase domain-containing protein n=1 Tax=Letharia lupina TaxID=560253 RepID=A0A8H6FDI1_9LECA|nr:uncharacterized protein HO133_011089 [Letharia lupina]KAF6224512.1 hypothetical protein HO133_011089 [Letharia lupina]
MATAAGYFDRKPPSATRPRLSHLQPDPSSPHTPQRTLSSAFNSPSLSYRTPEEETIIFEFGNRHFSAGFPGESAPRCRLGFGPEQSRRVGDYKRWMPGFGERKRKRRRVDVWDNDHELWRMDVRGLDMGLVGDKIERAVREAVTKHLLIDMKGKRLVVVLPSLMPHPLLNTVLGTLFATFQSPRITLLSSPILNTVMAGLRSGLVIDIGWRETVVTGIYEYREVHEKRTTRAMRMVTLEMAMLLEREQDKNARKPADASKEEADDGMVTVDLEQAEEVTTRMAWCRSRSGPVPASSTSQDLPAQFGNISIAEDEPKDSTSSSDLKGNTPISIPLPSSPRLNIQLPFSALALPVETALLGNSLQRHQLDDHEQPLHKLIYQTLLSLPPDVRAVCMSRIIFTGGGSNILGLKARLLDEVAAIVETRGWDPVEGKAAEERRRRLREVSGNRQATKVKEVETKTTNISMDQKALEGNISSPASLAPQLQDSIEEKIQREKDKGRKPTVSGVIRGVETLGAWAGASLLVNLRIKGVVEIERDAFLQHGLAGARKDAEASAAPQKAVPRPNIGWQTGWTLGPWA